MAENEEKEVSTQKTKTKKEKTPRTWSSTKVLDCVAYFAIMFIAIALIFKLIFKDHNLQVSDTFGWIGECLAYVICIWLGLYWTLRKRGTGWNKRNIWWLVAWIIAAVVIIIVYIFAVK